MKLLTALMAIQLVLLCALFARVLNLESSLAIPQATQSALPVPRPVSSATAPQSASANSTNEAQLRAIIREELRVALASSVQENAQSPRPEAPVDPEMEIEFDYRRDDVAQTLDYYTQVGQITEADMARLQADIAKLRPEDRRAMLGELVRAINTGAIDGRL